MPKYIAGLLLMLSAWAAGPVNYDIVYVRAPRSGDNTYVRFPDVFFPTAMPSCTCEDSTQELSAMIAVLL